ncbi:MAG TPA: RraA family protein, partial [Alphaproteobacteria bacterium]|nr:RraA family protein [Alphaproteobacteria bacterium]
MHHPEKNLIEALRQFSTPTICNAIEMLRDRLQNEGYTNNNQNLIDRNPQSHPMVGYAITLKMRTANPPMSGRYYADREDWWNTVHSLPLPRIAVIQDLDIPTGVGSIAGITHAIIFKALGCIGIVTNGAIRDLSLIKHEKLHIYSRKIVPSHAYSHIVEVGTPVKIAGLAIKPGDLLHGDINGIVSVPIKNVKEVLTNAQQVFEKKKKIIDFFHSKDFNLSELKKI